MIKQIIVVRTDLNMRKGKLAAQVAHASMKVFFDRMKIILEKNINLNERMYCCRFELNCKNPKHFNCTECNYFELAGNNCDVTFTPEMIEWKEGSFAKIVVGCNSEQELFELQKQAEEAGIVNAIILDNGRTEFKEICSECNGLGIVGTSVGSNTFRGTDYKCNQCDGTGKINKPTYTCLAIGPDESEKIDKITGKLKLL